LVTTALQVIPPEVELEDELELLELEELLLDELLLEDELELLELEELLLDELLEDELDEELLLEDELELLELEELEELVPLLNTPAEAVSVTRSSLAPSSLRSIRKV
jgi:hypothetical protein